MACAMLALSLVACGSGTGGAAAKGGTPGAGGQLGSGGTPRPDCLWR
jgi:hypothetical protein